MKKLEFNKIFAFFLKQKGLTAPKFKKTKYGYRSLDNKWKLFEKNNLITFIKPISVYNGYEYDEGLEETQYRIIQTMEKISIVFEYTKVI